ncbi:hypothetical protein DFH06DRAFT_1445406 [Mycena polygramma]|nr:hypothetical protein DFH06DRAFT_1445406 [Mycena polygramma]
MHSCLKIAEIVDIICSHIDLTPVLRVGGGLRRDNTSAKCDLAAVAQTCMAFREPALDYLWSSTALAELLIRCMPSDLWAVDPEKGGGKGTRQLRPIHASDWSRLSLYAPRVRELTCGSDGASLHHIFPTLSLSFPETLLRNVRTLDWAPNAVDFHFISCPRLTDFSIWTDTVEFPPVSRFVRDLRLVRTLCASLDQDALENLSTLPALESLTLVSLPLNLTVSPVHRAPRFPGLLYLEVQPTDLASMMQFLQFCRNVPLQTYDIHFFNFLDSEETYELYDALAARISHSTLAVLDLSSECDARNQFDITSDVIPPTTLLLLYCFHNLTSLSISSPLGFDLDDTAVLQMALAFPRLETLYLRGSLPANIPRTTHECLRILARHCPRLWTIAIAFDSTAIPVPSASLRADEQHERLHHFDVQHSPINNPSTVAQLISSVFPNACQIHTL